MEDPDEFALVKEALTCRESNSIRWVSDRVALRVRNDPELQGLTPEGIKRLTKDHARSGGEIEQIREKRPEYKEDHAWWYKVIIPVNGLPFPLFVEICLFDPDPELPEVIIVNAHLDR